jgi:hypothetical protein
MDFTFFMDIGNAHYATCISRMLWALEGGDDAVMGSRRKVQRKKERWAT